MKCLKDFFSKAKAEEEARSAKEFENDFGWILKGFSNLEKRIAELEAEAAAYKEGKTE